MSEQDVKPAGSIDRYVLPYISSLPDLTGKTAIDIPSGEGRAQRALDLLVVVVAVGGGGVGEIGGVVNAFGPEVRVGLPERQAAVRALEDLDIADAELSARRGRAADGAAHGRSIPLRDSMT